MTSKLIIINRIEQIVQYGTKKQLIAGNDEYGNERIIYAESWIKKNIGDEFYFIEKIEENRVFIFPDDHKLNHPIFKIGEMYKFKLKEIRSKKDNELYYVFLGIDNLEYEIKKHEWMSPFLQEIDKEYNLIFDRLYKGRINFKFNVFYDFNSFEKINGIKEYFNSTLLEDHKNYVLYKKQYEDKHNNWVITFSNHLSEHLYNARNRKDWLEFKKINLILYELERWIISSGYLQLFKKEDSVRIKNRITESRKLNNNFIELIDKIISFKEEEYILDLKEILNEREEFNIIYIIIFNTNVLDNLLVVKKIFTYINKIKIQKYDLTVLLNSITNKIYLTNKDIRDNHFNYNVEIKNIKIEHLIYLNVIVYNLSLLYNIKIKPKLYLIKIVSLLSNLQISLLQKYIDLKKKIFNNFITFEVIEELEIKYIISIFEKFDKNSKKDVIDIKINTQHKVEVIGKLKNGFIVLLKDNIAILPNIFLFKSKINDLNIGEKIELFVREVYTDFNLLVFSSYKNTRITESIEEIEVQKQFHNKINDQVKGVIKNVADYGVFVSFGENQKGLLHKKNIHPYFTDFLKKYFKFDNELFVNILNIDKKEGLISFSNIEIFDKFFNGLKTKQYYNIKIIYFQNQFLNLSINDNIILPIDLDDINIDGKFSFEDISSFTSTISFTDSCFNFSEISNVIFKDLYNINDLKNLFNELSYTIEEIGVNHSDFTKKIELLELTKMLFGFSSNNRSYFIQNYISYIKLLEDFINNDNNEDIHKLIIEIEGNSQLITSFKSFEYILNHLKLISCFEQINPLSFYKLIDFYFQDGYKNISREILKYNLLNFEKKDINLKTKIKEILSKEMVDQISSDRIFGDTDVFDKLDNTEDLKLKEVLTIISNGESNKVEFKESFTVPINDQSKIDKKIENVNLKISTNETEELKSEYNDIIFEIQSTKADVLIHSVLKTIVAFANTKGGDLFIGVDDSGMITGLRPDYSKFYKDVNSDDVFGLRDKFKLNFDEFINNWVDPEVRNLIEINIHCYKGLDFCHINVQKKTTKNLLFLYYNIDKKTQSKVDTKTWYYRGIANSRAYTSEELVSYYTNLIS